MKIVDGRYQIKDQLLGKGSFASTYLCIDNKTGNIIACKMVSKKHLIDKINLSKNKSLTKEYFIHALKTEVKTWKSIHHKNIVEFIDFSETPNNIYFFLEYCSGGYDFINLETCKLCWEIKGPFPKPRRSHWWFSWLLAASTCTNRISITETSKLKISY